MLSLMKTCRRFREPCEQALYRTATVTVMGGCDQDRRPLLRPHPFKLLDCIEGSARVQSLARLIPTCILRVGPPPKKADEKQIRAASLLRYLRPTLVSVESTGVCSVWLISCWTSWMVIASADS